MKSLFREEYETYTDEAVEISQEMGLQIRKLIEHYCGDCGYSLNEIRHILIDEVTLNCSEFKILRNIAIKREKKRNVA